MVLPSPTGMELRDASLGIVEVKRKNFSEFFDAKGTNGDRNAVKEPTSVFSIVFADLLQHSFVRLIQGPW
jgi:hypothetical protein